MSKRILKTTMNAVALNNSNLLKISTTTTTTSPPEYSYDYTNTHSNANILLAGGVILVVLLLCYCCHKNVRKHRQHENPQNRRVESDDHNLEIFAMDAMFQQCPERSASQTPHSTCFVTSEPPPTYESIFDPRAVPSPIDKKDESDDLGSIIAPRTGIFPTELEANWINKREDISKDDQGLPSYEAALKLEADGYV
ncbi:uncharacterized protein LOC105187490 [Harpegnathos saltator]|uniref:Uncharacterized protein n=1 Tax=Harpegnathos saltator TaxID=610380 RepID=E2BWS5_HARSA|nr:uncharacterized protein LOC105187490 [Harpegnathos saltator]XP_025160583.1 uncharacterized protein LOC105187490 [Harpegnathos saltator]XP_025160584.1 uncharacterized protein LOC105187490 [Harpegnathos saltator]EFN79789.1 hypothetical protein EAI_10995 [Harpegnathos saltator]